MFGTKINFIISSVTAILLSLVGFCYMFSDVIKNKMRKKEGYQPVSKVAGEPVPPNTGSYVKKENSKTLGLLDTIKNLEEENKRLAELLRHSNALLIEERFKNAELKKQTTEAGLTDEIAREFLSWKNDVQRTIQDYELGLYDKNEHQFCVDCYTILCGMSNFFDILNEKVKQDLA